MSDTRVVRRALPTIVLAAAVAVTAFMVGSGPQSTDATWVVPKTAAVTATAVTLAQPTALTCPSGGGILTSVPLTWTAPVGATPSGYTLKWTGNPTGSTWPTTSGTVTPPLIGTITVSVYADYGSWQSAAGTQTRTVSNLVLVWGCGP